MVQTNTRLVRMSYLLTSVRFSVLSTVCLGTSYHSETYKTTHEHTYKASKADTPEETKHKTKKHNYNMYHMTTVTTTTTTKNTNKQNTKTKTIHRMTAPIRQNTEDLQNLQIKAGSVSIS